MRASRILYREFWGQAKRAEVLASLEPEDACIFSGYEAVNPTAANRYSLRPANAQAAYETWPDLPAIAAIPAITGLKENRGFVLIQPVEENLVNDMEAYFDAHLTFDDLRKSGHKLTFEAAGFNPRKAREQALIVAAFDRKHIYRYALRPFEIQYCYWTEVGPLWNRARPSLVQHHHAGNTFLVSRPNGVSDPEGFATHWITNLADFDYIRGHAYHFPATLFDAPSSSFSAQKGLFSTPTIEQGTPNLSAGASNWLASLSLTATPETSRLVWHHALAITYSPAYLAENAAGIRQGWPRIPLPGDAELLRASAALGERLAALLDPEAHVPGLGQGLLASIAIPNTVPAATRDWRLNGWGSRTDKGVTMPGRGKTDLRPYGAAEAAAQAQAALLGAQTRDVWMNGASFWKNIPEAVWETHIGGYQVLKKWLSYRDHSIIARPLTQEEVAHIQATARRLAAILLIGPDLDANYRASAEAHVPLPVT
jgi:hypothetical protein